MNNSITDFCKDRSSEMHTFLRDIYALDFKEKPNYDQFRQYLKQNYDKTQPQATKTANAEDDYLSFKKPTKKNSNIVSSELLVPVSRRSTADTSAFFEDYSAVPSFSKNGLVSAEKDVYHSE